MRRAKKQSLPGRSVSPPARRRGSSAAESESSCDLPASSSSACDSNSQGEPPPPSNKEKPPRVPDAASVLQLDPLAAREAPPPPCLADVPGARRSALRSCDMFGVFRSIPTQMDYKGQKLAEQIFQGIILVSAVIGFIYGYITEQFGWTVYIVMAGFALSCLLTLPPWPIYRRNPLKWLPVQELATDDKKPADKKVKRHPKN
ncbi:signal peptidase complex subunit 1 [Tiliqua scincoides]|uniref:signal peptidase complex subunit 1 n=1 Tax=Tiliqua scincoides TaxID=71010 RepID=UPI00346297E8